MKMKYVKKPVIIEAVQWTGKNQQELIDFCGSENVEFEHLESINEYIPVIKTMEGNMDCKMFNFVIKGLKGEFYPCDEEIFHLTYDLIQEDEIFQADLSIAKEVPTKSLHNTDTNEATKNVKDIKFWGDGNTFKLISKASSENEGWMKSTKAMEIEGVGCVVQVTTQQINPDQSYSLDDSVTFVPNTKIETTRNEDGKVIARKLVDIKKTLQK
jgi:hypothetical protein